MKKLIKNILLLLAILTMWTACKKQLDLNPYNSISQSQSFITIKDAASWDHGFYSSLRSNVYGVFTTTQDVQADQLDAGLDFGNRGGAPYRWGQYFLADDYSLSGVWSGYYTALANVNLCIDNFKNIAVSKPSDQDSLNRYLGDAYLARAYYYSELAIRFAKPYEPPTAATDLGVPLVLTYDVNLQLARATLQETYNQILSDIAQAKTLLVKVTGTKSSTTFNIDVANALEARVRLYMQDWNGAMAAANAVISTNTYPLINNQADFTAMWQTDVSTEVIYQLFVSKPNELPLTNSIYLGYNPAVNRYDPDFIPTQSVVNLYDNADIRKAAYFSTLPCTISGLNYNLVLTNKYPGNPALFTTTTTNYAQAPKIFRIAEQYLIYAEAAARSGSNDAQALAALNALRTARGIATLPAGTAGATLLQAVKDERTKELAFEGFRLWDLKRWHQGFTRGTPQNLAAIVQGDTYNLLTIAPDDPKFTWGIPTNDVSINKNLIQNPGW